MKSEDLSSSYVILRKSCFLPEPGFPFSRTGELDTVEPSFTWQNSVTPENLT